MKHKLIFDMHQNDMTLARWCRDNDESYHSAIALLQGRLTGRVAKRIARKLREDGYNLEEAVV